MDIKNENPSHWPESNLLLRGGQPFKRLGKGKATVQPTQGQALRVLQYFFDSRLYIFMESKKYRKNLACQRWLWLLPKRLKWFSLFKGHEPFSFN